MNSIQTIFQWFTHNQLAGSAIFFGGAMLAVILYTYLYDYKRLTSRD
jgi:hypothetical protein